MNLFVLRPGDRLQTIDGDVVEVVAPSQDGEWIQVRYIEAVSNPALVGTLDLCNVNELTEQRPAATK